MFVDSKTFMELIAKVTRIELEHKADVERLENRIKTLENRPIVIADDSAKKSTDKMERLFEEMTMGVKDINTGRVTYTDGRD